MMALEKDMLGEWIASRLSRKLVGGLAAGMMLTSLVFLVLFVGLYRARLEDERGKASAQINRLLQGALENSMLKRDLSGLRDIVNRLGQLDGIDSVMIVNPEKEVRFASDPNTLGRVLSMTELGCPQCGQITADMSATTYFTATGIRSQQVLRSVNPIRNLEECGSCHGPANTHPINGVLIVDQNAGALHAEALTSAGMLAGAGLLTMTLTLGALGLLLRSCVLHPIANLTGACRTLASGNLSARALVTGRDEFAELSASFNAMAEKLARSRRQIEDSAAFLQRLIDAVPDGVRVIDENYRVLMANRAYCEKMSASPDKVIGAPCYQAHGRDEPCAPTMITCPIHARPADGQQLKYVHRHIDKDGQEFHVEITAAGFEGSRDGAPQRLIVEAIRDLTQQARYSQEQRLAELGQLATGVAHEIYNPLGAIRLGLQSIAKRLGDGNSSPQELVAYTHIAQGEIDKCIKVTKRLLDLAMPPSQHGQIISLTTVIPEVVSLLAYEAEIRKVALDLDLGNEELRVLATDSELRMLVLNIVQNAFHAMPRGGTLTISCRVEAGMAAVAFSDTGVGIAPDVIARIYDPFFSQRADAERGTGLGLTICKSIVKRHGGAIEVRSKLGEGTTFTVRFPQAEAS
jgi:PAS domain S-box-containing protein